MEYPPVFEQPWSPPASPNALEVGPGHVVTPPVRGFQLDKAGSLQGPEPLLEQLAGFSNGAIGRTDALKCSAVLKARNMIAGVPATMPIQIHAKDRSVRDDLNSVVTDPDPDLERSVVMADTLEDLLFHKVSYWLITSRVNGFPATARHLDHRSVSQHAMLGMPSEIIGEDLPFSPRDPIFVDGEPVPSSKIIRFVSPNPPLLRYAAKAIRIALTLDLAAEMYASDPLPFGYFTDSEDADPLDDDEVKNVLNAWEDARRQRVWGYVGGGLELNKLEWPTPEQLQLVQARQHAVLDIARASMLDPDYLGVPMTNRTYQNVEQRRLDLIDFTLMIYMTAVTDRLSKDDVTPRGSYARFDTTGFLRGDFLTRMNGYKAARAAGAMTADEIRAAENRPVLSADESAIGQGGQTRELQLVEQIQKIYLGVGTVITAAEAREILNRSGAGLDTSIELPGDAPDGANQRLAVVR